MAPIDSGIVIMGFAADCPVGRARPVPLAGPGPGPTCPAARICGPVQPGPKAQPGATHPRALLRTGPNSRQRNGPLSAHDTGGGGGRGGGRGRAAEWTATPPRGAAALPRAVHVGLISVVCAIAARWRRNGRRGPSREAAVSACGCPPQPAALISVGPPAVATFWDKYTMCGLFSNGNRDCRKTTTNNTQQRG